MPFMDDLTYFWELVYFFPKGGDIFFMVRNDHFQGM